MILVSYVTDSLAVYAPETPDPEAQAALLLNWAARHNHKVPQARLERDPERRWGERAGLTEAVEAIRAKTAHGLLCYSLGTLGLTATEILSLVKQVALAGGHLIAVADAIDSTTPAGVELVRKFYDLSQCLPHKLRGPTPTTLSGRPKKSRYVPFGWRLGKTSGPWERRENRYKDLEPVRHPVEQVILQDILDKCDGTGKSAYALAKEFNAQGRQHPRLKKPWAAGNVLAIYRSASRYQQDAHTEIAKLALGVREAS